MFNLERRRKYQQLKITRNKGKYLHIKAVKCHPSRPIRLTQIPSRGQRFRPVESANVIQAEEPAFEYIVTSLILAVYPPISVPGPISVFSQRIKNKV